MIKAATRSINGKGEILDVAITGSGEKTTNSLH